MIALPKYRKVTMALLSAGHDFELESTSAAGLNNLNIRPSRAWHDNIWQ